MQQLHVFCTTDLPSMTYNLNYDTISHINIFVCFSTLVKCNQFSQDINAFW